MEKDYAQSSRREGGERRGVPIFDPSCEMLYPSGAVLPCASCTCMGQHYEHQWKEGSKYGWCNSQQYSRRYFQTLTILFSDFCIFPKTAQITIGRDDEIARKTLNVRKSMWTSFIMSQTSRNGLRKSVDAYQQAYGRVLAVEHFDVCWG